MSMSSKYFLSLRSPHQKCTHLSLTHTLFKTKYYTSFFTDRNAVCPTYLKRWTMSNMTTR